MMLSAVLVFVCAAVSCDKEDRYVGVWHSTKVEMKIGETYVAADNVKFVMTLYDDHAARLAVEGLEGLEPLNLDWGFVNGSFALMVKKEDEIDGSIYYYQIYSTSDFSPKKIVEYINLTILGIPTQYKIVFEK